MSRRSGAVAGPEKANHVALTSDGSEKQKMLLSADTGHFSLIKYISARAHKIDQLLISNVRALHLADLITELNGFCGCKVFYIFTASRHPCSHLPSHVHPLLNALLSR